MASEEYARLFGFEVETLAAVDVQRLWDRMAGEFLGEFERLTRQGLEGADLERELRRFMGDLSDKPTVDQARQSSTVAYQAGRDAETQTAADDGRAVFVLRSEVLDTNTCRPCQLLDGEVFEIGTPEYDRNHPPAQCDGGDRCRGVYIPITSGLEAAP